MRALDAGPVRGQVRQSTILRCSGRIGPARQERVGRFRETIVSVAGSGGASFRCPYFICELVRRTLLRKAADEAAIEAALPRAQTVFAELARLLGEQPFIAGDALSLADLQTAPHLSFLSVTPEWEALTAPHPHLLAWIARLEARPSFMATTMERLMERAKAA
jgi:glutathione S-transferase